MYISSSAMKIPNADIFTTQYEIYLVFTETKCKFSCYFILKGDLQIDLQIAQPNYFPGCFSFFFSVFIWYNVGLELHKKSAFIDGLLSEMTG